MLVFLLQTLCTKRFLIWLWLFNQRAICSKQFFYQQWENVKFMWKKHVEKHVGPIVGNFCDGDSTRRQLMLKDYSSTGGI